MKQLNLYILNQLYDDGEDVYPVISCLIRAEDEDHARKMACQFGIIKPTDFEDPYAWADYEKSNCIQVGWATGNDADKPGIIDLMTGDFIDIEDLYN